MISTLLLDEIYQCIRPRERISTVDWATARVRMPQDSKVKGGFRLDLFPYMREPFEAFDDPNIDTVTIQTASQVGKTTFAQVCVAKVADTNPHPMAWGEPDERSCRRVLKRTWRLFEKTLSLQDKLPPPHLRASDRMEASTFLIHGAWAGSAASSADFGALIVVLNETDKIKPRSTDQEADFRYLLPERMKGYTGAKLLQLSTPSTVTASFIEKQRQLGDNRAWMVPCPRCGRFQQLRTGDGKTPGGIIFDKGPGGELNAHVAEKSARYQCEHCSGEWQENERFAVMNAGRYVPEGCTINDDNGEMSGEPVRKGSHASFGPLPTLVSLLPGITIGRIAREWVKALTSVNKTEACRNFLNSWDGVTYDPRPNLATVDEVEKLLRVDAPAVWVCPEYTRFVTAGVDTGRSGDDLTFYWVLVAWGYIRRGHVIGHGQTYGEDAFRDLLDEWFREGFTHETGLRRCPLKRVGIDSGRGIDANRVYEFCGPLRNVWPIKGSSYEFTSWFDVGFQKPYSIPAAVRKMRKKHGLGDLLFMNTHRTQQWRVDLTTGVIKPNRPQFVSLPAEIAADHEFLAELIADYPDETGGTVKWLRDGPNEKGDALRYTLPMAEHYAGRNGYKWTRLPAMKSDEIAVLESQNSANMPPRTNTASASFRPPSGGAFVASQR